MDTCKNNKEYSSPENKIYLKVSFDGAWQKRGNGRAYNSLSGHATLIGCNSGKVISYAVRNQDCRKCKLGHPKDDHDCRRNFEGSAKAMESDMAVEMITKNPLFKEENVDVNVLVGDDDSSTIASVRKVASHEIEKCSDWNHVLKNFNNALYANKVPRALISYFSKNLSCSVQQNKGNSKKIRDALTAVVPHSFGQHDFCGDWCRSQDAGEKYQHNNLPNGKPLSDSALRLSLTQIFNRYIDCAEKLAECGSSQENESINNIVASKTPKARHYAASESLSFRIGAAICQKNLGSSYANDVFRKLELSPGKKSLKYRTAKNEKRQKEKVRKGNVQFKKQRLLKKKKKNEKSCYQRAQRRSCIPIWYCYARFYSNAEYSKSYRNNRFFSV